MSGTCKLFSLAVGHDLAVFAALLKNALHDTLNWPLRVFRSLCSGYAGSAAHRTHTAAAIEFCPQKIQGQQTAFSGSQSPFAWAPDESDATRRCPACLGRCTQTKANVCLTLDLGLAQPGAVPLCRALHACMLRNDCTKQAKQSTSTSTPSQARKP